MSANTYSFRPYNVGRFILWSLFALVLLVAPKLFTSSLSMTMLTQMGIAVIVCLSYNMLLGQGGMLSFGHAVYSGLGSFAAIHTLNKVGAGDWAIPVMLVPSWVASPVCWWRCCWARSARRSRATPSP
jgi:branched-chain amino acid transport system permease protein